LKDDADPVVERRRRPLAEVAAIEQIGPRSLVHPGEQLDQRGLAAAVLADDRPACSRRDMQVDAGQRGDA